MGGGSRLKMFGKSIFPAKSYIFSGKDSSYSLT